MIRLQIVERKGAKLYKRLIDAMRSGDLRTFTVADRGKKVTHIRHPGQLRWSASDGQIVGTLRGTKSENGWRLLGAFVGRLADKYADRVESISISFKDAGSRAASGKRPAKKKRAAR